MILDTYELLAISAAVVAILMLGTTHIRNNLDFYSAHTFLIAGETAWFAHTNGHDEILYWVAVFFGLVKAILIPRFLSWVVKRIDVDTDAGSFIVAPMAMMAGIGMLGVSYLLSAQLPGLSEDIDSRLGAMAAMSIIFTGVLLMLARKIAISQITGFLVLENGIYLFALTQTHGMPMIIEMGVLLELLGCVMMFGLLLFRIKKSFEHIDVTQLTELRES
jgi:hydrogenase-4 component E